MVHFFLRYSQQNFTPKTGHFGFLMKQELRWNYIVNWQKKASYTAQQSFS